MLLSSAVSVVICSCLCGACGARSAAGLYVKCRHVCAHAVYTCMCCRSVRRSSVVNSGGCACEAVQLALNMQLAWRFEHHICGNILHGDECTAASCACLCCLVCALCCPCPALQRKEQCKSVAGKTMKNIMLLLVCTALHPEMCSWQCLHDK